MRRRLKRIAIVLACLALVGLLTAAFVGWRTTRVPAWYATAVEETPPSSDADAAINDRVAPLQNWLARTSSGDLDAKPAADKIYTLELAENEINALLAKFRDNVHGSFESFRVRLRPDRIDLAFTWTDQGRIVTVGTDVDRTGDRPAVSLGTVKLGDQAVPIGLISRAAVGQVRQQVASMNDVRPKIDDNDGASRRTVEKYYARLMLAVLSGQAVKPEAFLPKQFTNNEMVATRVVGLDVTEGRCRITFRFLTPEEREQVLADLAAPLPAR